jgi:hypothetical protein
MALVRSRCLILQSYPYSETSRILRLLTEDFGVQSVIAKGARRPKSRFGGLLEPFTEGTASFYHRETRDLHTLGGSTWTAPTGAWERPPPLRGRLPGCRSGPAHRDGRAPPGAIRTGVGGAAGD